MVEKTRFYIIAYAALGKGLSGGDNILIELSRRWADKLDITIKGGEQILEACIRKNLHLIKFDICPSLTKFRYIERMFWALKTAFKFKDKNCIVYTASDFLHDLLCGWIIKLKNPKIRWITGYYLVLCPPFASECPYKGFSRLRGIGYWLMQRFTLQIVKKWANVVYVTSEPEKLHFPNKRVIVVRGGVNLKEIDEYLEKNLKVFIPFKYAEYDAVFMGRLHYQKGILELMKIWKMVNKKLPQSRLLVIGDGILKKKAQKIAPPTVTFVGYKEGKNKYDLICNSKIILHTSTYDSGGMACAEGMAFGIPAVGFDLEVFKTYYSYGMLKAKTKEEFAQNIISLLTDEELFTRIRLEARHLIVNEWDWDKRAKDIYNETQSIFLS